MWGLLLLAFANWQAIEQHLNAGRYQEALAGLEAKQERTVQWHVLASKTYDAMNVPARAVAEAEAALRLDPKNEAAHVQLGYVFLSRNTPLAAVEIFSEAERIFPQSMVVRLGKGLALKELQRYDEAEKTLAACWPHALAFDALATVLIQRAKFGEARNLAARYIEARPDDYRGYYFLAASKDGLQEPDAREAIQQSLARKADFAASHALLGKIQLRVGELNAAVSSFEEAIRRRPDLIQAHLQLAQTYRKLGRASEAKREFAIVRDLTQKEAQPKPSLRYHRGQK